MAYRVTSPNFAGASAGNRHLDSALRGFDQRLALLETKTGTQAIKLNKPGAITQAPPRSLLDVSGTPASGRWIVTITNPEFATNAGNPARTPIYHQLEYSPDQSFSSNVVTLPPGHQTYYPIFETPSTTLYFRVRSSYDGITWNKPVVSKGVAG